MNLDMVSFVCGWLSAIIGMLLGHFAWTAYQVLTKPPEEKP